MRYAVASLLLLFAAPADAQSERPGWVAGWASAQMPVEGEQALTAAQASDATLRQLVRVTLGGPRIRVRISNAFGTQPLVVDAAAVAIASDPADDSARSGRALTFVGRPAVTIPAGAEYWSDPVDLPVRPLTTVAVSLHLPSPPARQTGHPGSRATSWLARGNQVLRPELRSAEKVDRWYQLSGVDVLAPAGASTIVALGDSITDGYGVQPNTNARWTDTLAQRLAARGGPPVGIVNAGIGGNRLLLDGSGPNAVARFDRDVLGQSGVRWLILLEGVNDLGTLTREAPVATAEHRALVDRMLTGMAQIVARARARGIKVIAGTILPYGGSGYYHPDAANEVDRQAINTWLRTPGNVDAVIDFDALMRDPARPTHMKPALDSGDGLHPSIAGYRAMGEAVPLSLFD